jgi:hypothetical protein
MTGLAGRQTGTAPTLLLGADHTMMARYDPDCAIRVVATWSSTGAAYPIGTEAQLAGFTELAATAAASAQARVELRGYAEEQAALRRVAVQVAQGAPEECWPLSHLRLDSPAGAGTTLEVTLPLAGDSGEQFGHAGSGSSGTWSGDCQLTAST